MALPRKHRLKGTREFANIFSSVRPHSTEHLSMRATRTTPGAGCRVAVVVPSKTASLASARNLLRRRVTEIVSRVLREESIIAGVHVVVTVRSNNLPGSAELRHELLSLMKKSGILTK